MGAWGKCIGKAGNDWQFWQMEHYLFYAAITLVRQDYRINRDAYQWEDGRASESSLERVRELVRQNWPKNQDGINLEELEEVAIQELMNKAPSKFNPLTGKYE